MQAGGEMAAQAPDKLEQGASRCAVDMSYDPIV
jgi:hypothetical protein